MQAALCAKALYLPSAYRRWNQRSRREESTSRENDGRSGPRTDTHRTARQGAESIGKEAVEGKEITFACFSISTPSLQHDSTRYAYISDGFSPCTTLTLYHTASMSLLRHLYQTSPTQRRSSSCSCLHRAPSTAHSGNHSEP
jgi:hypothetical protein